MAKGTMKGGGLSWGTAEEIVSKWKGGGDRRGWREGGMQGREGRRWERV